MLTGLLLTGVVVDWVVVDWIVVDRLMTTRRGIPRMAVLVFDAGQGTQLCDRKYVSSSEPKLFCQSPGMWLGVPPGTSYALCRYAVKPLDLLIRNAFLVR